MKNQCSKCKHDIDNWDFYVESRSGKICSSCLVAGEMPSQEYKSLFKPGTAQREQGVRIATLRGLEELGLRDLEQEPLSLARSNG